MISQHCNPLVTLEAVKYSLRNATIAALASTALLLTSCTPPGVQDPKKQAEEQASAGQTVSGALGKATPAASPAATQLAGEVLKLEGPLAQARDIELAGDVLAVRTGDRLALGALDKFRTNSAQLLEISASCGDVTVTGDTFVLPCPTPIEGGAGGGVIYLINSKNPNLSDTRRASMKFTSAVLTSTGEVIGGSSEEPDVMVFRGMDSAKAKKISTSRKADEMVASPVPGSRDGVVFIEREKTVIQGVDFNNDRPGAALRMGVGVGAIAAGDDGLFLASDTLGHQLGVYTDDDVLMLHQTIATDKSPWALAWDSRNKLAWISSNESNKLQAFKISSGVPELQGSLDTIANVRSMTIDSDGRIYAVSDSGEGLQIISPKDVAAAVDKPAQQ